MRAELDLLAEALALLEQGFAVPPGGPRPGPAERAALLAAAARLHDNLPYHEALYLGHMQKPPHPVARLAYTLALRLNPNNHGYDGGRASSIMEREAVAEIAAMFGWREHLGHLCGGGTLANLEALWVARERRPGLAVAASEQAHYSHRRLAGLLAVPFVALPCDARGRLDPAALERRLEAGGVGTVVATLGTSAAGAVDPLDEIAALRRRYDFHLHVDAAYGGYFALIHGLETATRRAFDALALADSITVDPHKHGLQPYGCGCILYRDPAVAEVLAHDSPYTYLATDEPHLGRISLEGSRPGAAAVALWTTQRLLPLVPGGAFARGLEAGREAALALHGELVRDVRYVPLFEPELDVVVWALRAESASRASARARALHRAAGAAGVHLSLAEMPRTLAAAAAPVGDWDADTVTCLRACLMKPEHRDWLPEIVRRLAAADDGLP